jgi:hypothetical protein
MEDAPPVANQIDLFMHFLGASRDGLVAMRVDLDMISSSVWWWIWKIGVDPPFLVDIKGFRK